MIIYSFCIRNKFCMKISRLNPLKSIIFLITQSKNQVPVQYCTRLEKFRTYSRIFSIFGMTLLCLSSSSLIPHPSSLITFPHPSIPSPFHPSSLIPPHSLLTIHPPSHIFDFCPLDHFTVWSLSQINPSLPPNSSLYNTARRCCRTVHWIRICN